MESEVNLTWGRARAMGWTREQYDAWLNSQGAQQQPETPAVEMDSPPAPPTGNPEFDNWGGTRGIDHDKFPDRPWIEMRCSFCNQPMLTKDVKNDICEGCFFRLATEMRDQAPKQHAAREGVMVNPFVGGDVMHSLYGSLPTGKK